MTFREKFFGALAEMPQGRSADPRRCGLLSNALLGTLYDHCLRALEHVYRLGSHGLPLMGTGDCWDPRKTMNARSTRSLRPGP